MNTLLHITFQPFGRSVDVLEGLTVLEAADRVGIDINAPCGANGQCGKCRVQFTTNAPQPQPEERAIFSADELAEGWRLACCCELTEEAVISVPDSSLVHASLQIRTDSQVSGGLEGRTAPVELLADQPNLAAAFDLGTTTLVGELLDLNDGQSLGVLADVNPQVRFGDDVISRISHALTAEGAEELRQEILDAINEQLLGLAAKAGVAAADIRTISVSGNTTMQHLLCGLDVEGLSHLPFEPARFESLDAPAMAFGLTAAPVADVYVMPVIGGFVGGDTVSGILTSNMRDLSRQLGGAVLMIDIGTNGELVLVHDGMVTAASTAAGPAFEGARIRHGMRAAPGAIEKITLHDDDFQIHTIASEPAIGLCGSALIDAASLMLETGLMDSMGRFADPDNPPADLPEALKARLRKDTEGRPELLLASGSNGDSNGDIVLTQKDIRELQLAGGALRAGVGILLDQAGIMPRDLKRVQIAGGFGSYIRPEHARRIGLIPLDVPAESLEFVGNISLRGAVCTALFAEGRQLAETLAREVTHVELSADMNFQMAFAEAMIFPDA